MSTLILIHRSIIITPRLSARCNRRNQEQIFPSSNFFILDLVKPPLRRSPCLAHTPATDPPPPATNPISSNNPSPSASTLPSITQTVLATLPNTTHTMAANMQDMMRSVQLALNVTKLTSSNYMKWKRDMEIRLRSAGLWSVITDPAPPAGPPTDE